jgi:ribosome-associated translation inhibitor RaiA
MYLIIQKKKLTDSGHLETIIQHRLRTLSSRVRIEGAQVVMERRDRPFSSFFVGLMVAVPGPDLYVEHLATTPLQAINNAFKRIEQRLRARALCRIGQKKWKSPGLLAHV